MEDESEQKRLLQISKITEIKSAEKKIKLISSPLTCAISGRINIVVANNRSGSFDFR